jgi:hypothetical protein
VVVRKTLRETKRREDVERKGEDAEEAREQQQYGKDGENVLRREVKVDGEEKCG